MQHEGELRSDIDCLMDVLRANPKARFTVSKLHACTGLPMSFLKKWINVLGEQGHIRFFYNIPDDEFSWVSSSPSKPARNDKEVASLQPKPRPGNNGGRGRAYSRDEMGLLLADVKKTVAEAKKLNARVAALKKSRTVDLAALGIAQLKLAEKKGELSHLLCECRRLKGP